MSKTGSGLDAPQILLIEDSPEEAELFCQAMIVVAKSQQPQERPLRIDVKHTTQDALTALKTLVSLDGGNLPKLLVLDLDLPGGTSLRFLRELRQEPRLKSLSILVMAWEEEEAIMGSLQTLGVNEYVVKPMLFDDLLFLVAQLCHKLSGM